MSGARCFRISSSRSPLISGILRSTIARSNSCRSAVLSASLGLVTAVTSKSRSPSRRDSVSMNRTSSSTMSSRIFSCDIAVSLLACGLGRCGPRQGTEEREGRPVAGAALDLDPTTHRLDDAVADRQTEARALADPLGREEREEDLAQHLGGHATPRVLDVELHPTVLHARAQGDATVPADGIAGVVDEVEQDLLELVRAGDELRELWRELLVHLDVRGTQVHVLHLEDPLDDALELHGRIVER